MKRVHALSMCVDVVSFTGACGAGISYVYMLNSVDDRPHPYGIPILNWRCGDVLFLNVV